MLKRGVFVVICGGILLLASPAGADVMDGNDVYTYDSNAPGADPHGPFICGDPDPNTFFLPKFDDTVLVFAFGEWRPKELTVITVNVTATAYDGYQVMDNEDDSETNALSLDIGAKLRVRSQTPAAPLVVIAFPHDSNSGIVAADNEADSNAGPDYRGTDYIGAFVDGKSDANHATIDVADQSDKKKPWVGAGEYVTWNFDANAHMFHDFHPSLIPHSLVQSPTCHFTADVIYQWVVSPEPMTVGLLGVGGAALLARRRRRRRRS